MQADYLVYTATSAGAIERLRAAIEAANPNETPLGRVLLGATGVQLGKTFVGRWSDGRWLLSATGDAAVVPWAELAAMPASDTVDESVARVDLQATVVVSDADAMVSRMRTSPRFRASLVLNLSERGSTLYVGAPGSDKRLRLYNKSAEAGITLAVGELLRVELQLRNRPADYALEVARRSTAEQMYNYWRDVVVGMAYDLTDVLPDGNTAHICLPERETPRSYRQWIERCVVPALGKASLTGEWPEIRALLLRALDAADGQAAR